MTKDAILVAAALMLAAGCAAGLPKGDSLAVSSTHDATPIANSAPAIALVDYEEPATPELVQPLSIVELQGDQAESVAPQQLPPTGGLTLEVLEQMALGNSPSIPQAAARVRALRGKWVQVGLPPNPTAGEDVPRFQPAMIPASWPAPKVGPRTRPYFRLTSPTKSSATVPRCFWKSASDTVTNQSSAILSQETTLRGSFLKTRMSDSLVVR